MNRHTIRGFGYCVVLLSSIGVLSGCSAALSKARVSGASSVTSDSSRGGGATVWDGVYTEEQASRGEEMYVRHCVSCHGGGDVCAPVLIGDSFWRAWADQSVGRLYEKIRSTMPVGAEGFFSRQEYADTVSYLLSANKVPAGQRELQSDVALLDQLVIQEKEGR